MYHVLRIVSFPFKYIDRRHPKITQGIHCYAALSCPPFISIMSVNIIIFSKCMYASIMYHYIFYPCKCEMYSTSFVFDPNPFMLWTLFIFEILIRFNYSLLHHILHSETKWVLYHFDWLNCRWCYKRNTVFFQFN